MRLLQRLSPYLALQLARRNMADTANMHRVFVYGTLKSGQPNHYLLQTKEKGVCKYMGTGVTADQYPLVVASRYNIPFLLGKPGVGHFVEGEIYDVDDKMLQELDRLESNTKLYDRSYINVQHVSKDDEQVTKETTLTCWCYCLVKYRDGLLGQPYLRIYNQHGGGHEQYVPPSKREDNGPSFWSEVHTGYTCNT